MHSAIAIGTCNVGSQHSRIHRSYIGTCMEGEGEGKEREGEGKETGEMRVGGMG